MKTEGWRNNTPGLRLVGAEKSGSASTTYGPVRVGLTTTPDRSISKGIRDLQLSASLNYLEREVEILESKFSEVSSILTSVMARLVELTSLLSAMAPIEDPIDE